jgi:SAM-dependent methyltransferase
MRAGWKCVTAGDGSQRGDVDATPAEFSDTMGYGTRHYDSASGFIAFHSGAWVWELHQALAELLDRSRSVLSIGSGECEHEVPFVLEGYDIVASDVVESATDTCRLFPLLRFQLFDVLKPQPIGTFHDVLITGVDFYFQDDDFALLIANVRTLLRPGGRFLFTLRYRDNLGTWLIDRVGVPAICVLGRVASLVGMTERRFAIKRHGYRRSIREVIRAAEQQGFRLGRIRHAGFGVELTRIYLDRMAPPLYAVLRSIDRRLHLLNNAVIFEFLS